MGTTHIRGQFSRDEALSLLTGIAAGSIGLRSLSGPPWGVYAGNVEYETSNGYRVVVFNDCNAWDYFDSIVSPDGRVLDYDEMADTMRDLPEPNQEEAWRVWGIPGYLRGPRGEWAGWQRHLFALAALTSETPKETR